MADNSSFFEQKLIKACQKQDPKAQAMLYKRFFGYAMGICLRYAYSKEEAGEILNDGFMKVFDKIHTFQNENVFKAWLKKVFVNTAIDYQRKNLKHHKHFSIEYAQENEESETALDKLSVDDILHLLSRLPQTHRLIFNLYEIEGYSHAEIAEMLQIAESSSRTILTRAKKQLRALFEVYFAEKIYERKLG